MSKPIKQMMMDDYADRFGDLDVVLVDIRGIEANDNNAIRSELAEAGIRIQWSATRWSKAALMPTTPWARSTI